MKTKWFRWSTIILIISFVVGMMGNVPLVDASSGPTFDFKESEFDAPSKKGFKYWYNELLSNHTPHHNGYDFITEEGQSQVIKGKFQYGDFRKDLEREWVSIYTYALFDSDASWQKIGRAKTNLDGRIRFEIPENQQLSTGIHLVKLWVEGDGTSANMYVYNLAEEAKTVVFDIDGTLTTDNFENVRSYLEELCDGDYVPKMHKDANRVAQYYADRGYTIVYLTARPYWLTHKSQQWLKDLGFPRGVIHTYDDRGLLVGDKTADYKEAYLHEIAAHGANIHYAYGNATTDIKAYRDFGLAGEQTYIIGPNAGDRGTTPIQSYTEHLKDLNEE
ncbi:hypothetical protein IC619_012390 [Hazenella sp. IB182353]|uniref:LNS2 domain-containing protein n=1 Tax=Polycladospora coralii TaxID=2771432 RepID=UPI0017477021|nr:HAD family acid phosphatase [Polycladospora coralii]MBS7531291.1 hypothetical protein [Polycladospora coralii]